MSGARVAHVTVNVLEGFPVALRGAPGEQVRTAAHVHPGFDQKAGKLGVSHQISYNGGGFVWIWDQDTQGVSATEDMSF